MHQEITALALNVWLWLETQRLGRSFNNALEYALIRANKCPEVSPWRSLLVNVKTGCWRAGQPFRYPRHRVLHALSLLLWSWSEPPDFATLQLLQRELATKQTAFNPLVGAYRTLWGQVN